MLPVTSLIYVAETHRQRSLYTPSPRRYFLCCPANCDDCTGDDEEAGQRGRGCGCCGGDDYGGRTNEGRGGCCCGGGSTSGTTENRKVIKVARTRLRLIIDGRIRGSNRWRTEQHDLLRRTVLSYLCLYLNIARLEVPEGGQGCEVSRAAWNVRGKTRKKVELSASLDTIAIPAESCATRRSLHYAF